MQLTPESSLLWVALGSGDFVIAQLVPFHFWVRVWRSSVASSYWPTAVQKLLLGQLTAVS